MSAHWADEPVVRQAVEKPGFDWCSIPLALQIASVALAFVFVLYVAVVYNNWKSKTTQPNLEAAEKTLGVTVIIGFATVGVAAASVLLAGAGVLLTFQPNDSSISTEAFSELVIAAVWLVISLFFGALAAAWTVNHVHHGRSVAEHELVMAASSGQFAALVIGSIHFVVAFFLF